MRKYTFKSSICLMQFFYFMQFCVNIFATLDSRQVSLSKLEVSRFFLLRVRSVSTRYTYT